MNLQEFFNLRFNKAVDFLVKKGIPITKIECEIPNVTKYINNSLDISQNEILILIDKFGINPKALFSENENFTLDNELQDYALLNEIAGLKFIIKNQDEYIKSLEELNEVNNDLLEKHNITNLDITEFSESEVMN
jgi:hypothetical protein